MYKKGLGAGFGLLVLSCVFLVLFVAGFILWFTAPKEEPVVPMNSSMNVSVFDAFLVFNASSQVRFTVSNGTIVLARGVSVPGAVESVKDISNGTVVFVEYYGIDYYWGSMPCNVSLNLTTCRFNPLLKADYNLVSSNGYLYFNISNGGIVQSPIVCVKYHSGLLNVRMSLPLVSKPDDLKSYYDLCYGSQTIGYSRSLPYVLVRNPLVNVSGNVTFLVRDRDYPPGVGIGDISTTIYI